ncbi:hypothetical protein [Cytobacillus purgationiresistens]|uniref:Uncharacterized protein n=1 Tax=Cytobacillus purgationiresistens TaxID=863449 RepID=A0ABU0AAU2_9BACI|nr:hypothetical protein [Cytobacillus purgationiresistens]MDQ0268377.1 hypothetical protein [Cytobacillus purgationiresistens]
MEVIIADIDNLLEITSWMAEEDVKQTIRQFEIDELLDETKGW